MGSPAKINFFALNIGIQQTCRRTSVEHQTWGYETHSFEGLRSLVNDHDIEVLLVQLPAARGMAGRKYDLRLAQHGLHNPAFTLAIPKAK